MKNINNEEFKTGDKVLTPYGAGIITDITGIVANVEHINVYSSSGKRISGQIEIDDQSCNYDIDVLKHYSY